MTETLIGLSKRMSYVLRHAPESVGLTLDEHGWVDLDALVVALNTSEHQVTAAQVATVVETSDKQRFALTDGRVRANQGHSVPVDLALPPRTPPAVLLHGTVSRFLPAILAEGLRPGSRQHVHLSERAEVANQVGARRGSPIVLSVDAAGMTAAGHLFYRSVNGVWLTESVPPTFITPG